MFNMDLCIIIFCNYSWKSDEILLVIITITFDLRKILLKDGGTVVHDTATLDWITVIKAILAGHSKDTHTKDISNI